MKETPAQRRRRLLGPDPPGFREHPEIVRGEGVRLWDAAGRAYLDCGTGGAHVGHCHPRVSAAVTRQAAMLSAATGHPHPLILSYAEQLLAKFDGPRQVLFVASGSEANDIALQMAQAATGRVGLIAIDGACHGHATALTQLSARPATAGTPGHVRLIPAPGSLTGGSANARPEAFARSLHRAIVELEETGFGFAALILCPILCQQGLPALDPGFFNPALGVVHRARGLVIADEMQAGFGRTGSHWWGHQSAGIAADIITLGRAMANGHPLAAVVAEPELMGAFREAFGGFPGFGGNPVALAAAQATLEVIEAEGLMENASQTGAYLLDLLRGLRHPRLAGVRGRGLSLAVAVSGPEPGRFAARVVEAMRERGVLVGRSGAEGQVLALRPPMPFRRAQADEAAGRMAEVLSRLAE